MTKRLIFCALAISLFACTQAKPITYDAFYTDEDREIFEQFLSHIAPYKNCEVVLRQTALFFLGKPYVAHTLEVTDDEMLVVNLREFDCMTFVETVIALTRTAVADNPTFGTFLDNLRNIRYRNGVINGYSSRLHYTSDWIFENERCGFLKNISHTLPGSRIERKEINFMSSNRHLYKHLKDDDAMLAHIIAIENQINQRGGFSFTPTEQIPRIMRYIPDMAVVAFTTSISGLDVQHVGFTFWENDRLTFIHASTSTNSVIIEPRTLAEYCEAIRAVTGVMIVEVVL